MISYFIYGPNTDIQPSIEAFNKNDKSVEIYGNGKNNISCSSIDLPENAHVIIEAHGYLDSRVHNIILCKDSPVTEFNLNLFGNEKALDIELFSCYGGSAIHSATILAAGSTLITFVSPEFTNLSQISQELRITISNLGYFDNQFIKFTYYLFTNPDTTKFAVKLKGGSYYFSSEINSLTESFQNLDDIRIWQHKQFVAFIEFCQKIKSQVNERNYQQIQELLDLYKNKQEFNNWLNQFDIERYMELLLISRAAIGDAKTIENLVNMDIDVNAKLIDGITALYIASEDGCTEIVEKLLSHGADPNAQRNDGATVLDIALSKGYTEIMIKLVCNGAKHNTENDYGSMALYFALARMPMDLIPDEIKESFLGHTLEYMCESVIYGMDSIRQKSSDIFDYFMQDVEL